MPRKHPIHHPAPGYKPPRTNKSRTPRMALCGYHVNPANIAIVQADAQTIRRGKTILSVPEQPYNATPVTCATCLRIADTCRAWPENWR